MIAERLAETPPLDRWETLGEILDQLDRRIVGTAPLAEQLDLRDVETLAKNAQLTTGAMVARLRRHGGKPFRDGKRWVIRAASLLHYYETLENQ